MSTATYQSIHDDQVGEGLNLAFPTMSTCAALIAVMDNTLVGIHKTQGLGHVRQTACFREAANLIAGRTIHELFIVGWNTDTATGHDINQVRIDLSCQAVDTYVFNYSNSHFMTGKNDVVYRPGGNLLRKGAADVCTFATFVANDSPAIGVKRTSKVTVTAVSNGEYKSHLAKYGGYAVGQYYSTEEDITTPTDHRHMLRKGSDFKRV